MAKHLGDPAKEQPDASEARWLVPWTPMMSSEKQRPKPFRVPSGELQTIIIAFQGTFEDDVPSRMLGYVSSLEGNSGKINQEAKLKLFPLGLFAGVAKVHRLQIVWALKMPIRYLSILIGILIMFPLLILSPKGLSGVMVCGPGSGQGLM